VNLIHAHQYTPFFYATAARWFGANADILLTEHGRHYPDYPRPKRRLANRLLLRGGDRVVAVGQAVRRALVSNDGFPAGRVEVVYNGIDLTAPGHALDSRHVIRGEMGVGDEDFVILQVARLDYLKDHATAIRTLAAVLARQPNARLVLVGEGPELGVIQDVVRQYNLDKYVRFLGLRRDVARLLSAADLFLLTSISEGIPLTLIEAMAASLPVVSTNVGGVPEVVESGRTGLLAPRGDDAALADAICTLASHPALRAEMGRLGRARAESLFCEQRMNERYDQLYREMLVRPPLAPGRFRSWG
jgi:glycosyltransferase involved in cell wall biosynthesis